MLKKVGTLTFFSVIFLISSSAFAQSYDDFMADAKVAFDANDYRKAIALLLKANRLRPEPKNLFRVARSYEEANDCGMGIVYFKAFLKEKNKKRSRVKTAKRAVAKARACGNYTPDLSGRLFIKSSPPGAGVSIDGEIIGVTPVEIAGYIEGKHVLRFELTNYKSFTKEVILEPGADSSAFVKLAATGQVQKNIKEEEKEDSSSPRNSDSILSVGLLIGLNYSQINSPTDPAGEPTLLFGSAFKGIGFTGGLTATFDPFKIGPGSLSLRVDFLGAFTKVSGFAENRTQNFRRELAFTDLSLRAPIMLGYTLRAIEHVPIFLFGGVDLLVASLKTESEQDNGITPNPIATRGPNPLSLIGVVGTAYEAGDWIIPIDLRFNYNPFTEKSTRARFDNYLSATSPGAYQVAFDWQIFVTLGISRAF